MSSSLFHDLARVAEGVSRVLRASAQFRHLPTCPTHTAPAAPFPSRSQVSSPPPPPPSPPPSSSRAGAGNVFMDQYRVPFEFSHTTSDAMRDGHHHHHHHHRGGEEEEDNAAQSQPSSSSSSSTTKTSSYSPLPSPSYSATAPISSGTHTAVFRERALPSTPLSRLIGFSRLGMQIAYGTARHWMRTKFTGTQQQQQQQQHEKDKVVEGQEEEEDGKAEVKVVVVDSNAQQQQQQQQQHEKNKADEWQNRAQASGHINSTHDSSSSDKKDGEEQGDHSRRGSTLRSAMLTDDNADRLAETLCRMRGAALKLGQMLSMQDEHLLPEPFLRALNRVRNQADIMPRRQLEKQLESELGHGWKERHFREFDMNPIAAASIGQVHRAVLHDGTPVAVKVQYPGVAESIDSDIKNLMRIVQFTGILPPGAFIDSTMRQARRELEMECDYHVEAANQRRFRGLIEEAGLDNVLVVPRVFDNISTRRVLVTELIPEGSKTIEQLSVDAPLEVRNHVARLLLDLCLRELFVFRFMQTDPNWSNFYYHAGTGKLYLLDFGACLEFPKSFIDEYIRVVAASATRDKETIIDASRKMGFLTGAESAIMNDAHAEAAMAVGEPFAKPGIYNFEDRAMTKKVTGIIPTMVKHRLTAPPPVSYSLHRKLSGSFLLCFKLGAQIECRSIFVDIARKYRFDNPEYKIYLGE